MSAATSPPDGEKKHRRLEKIMNLLKSWKGEKPDYDNLDFSNWHQSEESYQQEQREWMKSRKKPTPSGHPESE